MILDWQRKVVFHFQDPISFWVWGDIGSCQKARETSPPPKFSLKTMWTVKLSLALVYVVVNIQDITTESQASL